MKKQKDSGGWICEFGCDQAAFLKKRGTGCPHLEALIGTVCSGKHRSERVEPKLQYDQILTPEEEYDRKIQLESDGNEETVDDELNLRYNMRKLGISEKTIEVVVLRLIRGHTYQEIAHELRYSTRAGARIAYIRAIDKLKLNGYGRG